MHLLAEQLLASGRVANVALVGHPGVGKTTVAAAVLEHWKVRDRFNKIVRLDGISQKPDIRSLCQRLWDDIHDDKERYPPWLKQYFKPLLARGELAKLLPQDTLLLLDHVWTGDAFSKLNFCSDKVDSSMVLVTSRNRELLTEADVPLKECKVVEVPALEFESARRLLCQHAFPGKSAPTGDAWMTLIEKVVARCEHLPLALTV